jgi:hypothetical protein
MKYDLNPNNVCFGPNVVLHVHNLLRYGVLITKYRAKTYNKEVKLYALLAHD